MKLLGWMHRKLHNSGDVFKDFATATGACNCLSGGPSLDEYRRQNCTNSKTKRIGLRRPMMDQELFGGEDEFAENEAGSFIFGGFLTIGTLGSAALKEDEEVLQAAATEEEDAAGFTFCPATPAFGVAAEAIAEKEAEATTEEDLAVVSNELEKLLAVEAEKEASSTARNSAARISSARPSYASSKAAAGCPLQGFLFGSPVEVAETAGRKEKRASLGELFMRGSVVEEAPAEGGGEEHKEKKAAARVQVMVNRMLKQRGSRKVAGSVGGGGDGGDRSFAETKFQKILQIFHRKVHPESTTETKSAKKKNKDYIRCHSDVIPKASPKRGYGKEKTTRSFKCHSLPSKLHGPGASSGTREHWIRTDADYLVLEL